MYAGQFGRQETVCASKGKELRHLLKSFSDMLYANMLGRFAKNAISAQLEHGAEVLKKTALDFHQ